MFILHFYLFHLAITSCKTFISVICWHELLVLRFKRIIRLHRDCVIRIQIQRGNYDLLSHILWHHCHSFVIFKACEFWIFIVSLEALGFNFKNQIQRLIVFSAVHTDLTTVVQLFAVLLGENLVLDRNLDFTPNQVLYTVNRTNIESFDF
jgi:hypothetical protein